MKTILALLLTLSALAAAADQPGLSVPLQPEKARKPAADFALQDVTGKTIKLADFKGKVVLLDFWATWCTGCKKEIPWFEAFQSALHKKGMGLLLDVVPNHMAASPENPWWTDVLENGNGGRRSDYGCGPYGVIRVRSGPGGRW